MGTRESIGPLCTGTLLLAFLVLKFTGVIQWSWVWVLSPLWMPMAVVTAAFVFAATVRAFWPS